MFMIWHLQANYSILYNFYNRIFIPRNVKTHVWKLTIVNIIVLYSEMSILFHVMYYAC